jgi:hypothetical protein
MLVVHLVLGRLLHLLATITQAQLQTLALTATAQRSLMLTTLVPVGGQAVALTQYKIGQYHKALTA